MNKTVSSSFKLALIGVAGLFATTSQAAILSGPSADYPLPGTTVAAQPDLAGVVIEDLSTNFTISGAGETLSGTIQNRVSRGVDGTLTFSWRIRPTSGNGDLLAFRLFDFFSTAPDANWRIDGLGNKAPDIARYFGDGSGAVNFLFRDEVGVERKADGSLETSRFFFMDTDATHYNMTGKFDLLCAGTGCVSQVYSTFAPAVPVPAAVWLFGSGLIGLVGMARRKRSS